MSAATHSLDKADKRKYCHGHNIWISHCILRFNVSVMEGRKYFHQCCDLMEVVFSWLHVMSLLLNKGYETFWPSKPGHVFFGPLLFRYVGLQHTHKKKKKTPDMPKKRPLILKKEKSIEISQGLRRDAKLDLVGVLSGALRRPLLRFPWFEILSYIMREKNRVALHSWAGCQLNQSFLNMGRRV